MKRISFYIVLLCIALGASVSVSFAATSTLSSTAPIVGTSVGQSAGTLIFDYEVGVPGSNEVSINANTLNFTGTFWTQNAGWCTFNGLSTNGAKLTGTVDYMPMTGFAWCENAGWISFNPTGSISPGGTDVYFTKSTGLFHGSAWSENLGWMSMEGLMTDITAPEITINFKAFGANGSKVFTLSDPSVTIPTGGSYAFTVDNWDSGNHTYTQSSPNFTHDFRQAKLYSLKITDPFGNSSEGNVQVVADVPSDVLNATKTIASAIPTLYTNTFSDSKVADNSSVHSLNLKLRDQYGNPVINEPGIKTVNVRIAFNNNVDKNQSLFTAGILGDAIQFPATTFGGLSYLSGSIGIDSNTSGDYNLNISSYAPTKAGYAFTNNDDISLQKLSYQVIADSGNSGVGEVSETDKSATIGTNPLKFSPALYIGTITNTDNWSIRQGYDTSFQTSFLTGTNVSLTNQKVAHILDIDNSILISYQNPSNITGGTKDCEGFNKTTSTFNSAYEYSHSACNRYPSSNILFSNPSNLMSFSWKPTIIYAAPTNSTVKYSSEISYTNGTVDVKYPSYSRNNNSVTLADGTTSTSVGSGVINQSVKILGMTSTHNTIDVLSTNNTNAVGSLTRTDIKDAIHKNVETMTKWGISSSANYAIYTNPTLSNTTWPAGKDTIIIKWGDVTIDGNITGGSAIRGIIVLEDDAGNGGNIYITKDVSNIAAVLFADKSIISGNTNPTTYYSDINPSVQTATGQLFLQGSIISDNTIGWASMTPLKCPYNISGCDDQIAKRYDLNYFRFYTGTSSASPGSAAWVPLAGNGFPFVIEYDNRLQTAPPPGFTIIQ